MEKIIISKLESIDDIYDLVKENFLNKRNSLKKSNKRFEIIFDDLNLGVINIGSLNMLLCLLYSIRKHYDYPFAATFYSHIHDNYFFDENKSAFLKSIHFIDLTNSLRLLVWNFSKRIPDLSYNPNTKILQIDVNSISKHVNQYFPKDNALDESFLLLNNLKIEMKYDSTDRINFLYEEIKTRIKTDIKDYIRDFIESIFIGSNHGKYLKINIISYIAEILSNSFLHGRTKPFLALQRTSKKISISVCDDGLGLKASFERLHKLKTTERESIIKACMHRSTNSYGLYDIIYSVLGYNNPSFVMSNAHHGFFTISSGAYKLRITRNNFENLVNGNIEKSFYNSGLPIKGVRINLDLLIR